MTGWPSHAAGLAGYPRIVPVGDTAVSIEFGDGIDPALHGMVRALEAALLARDPPGLRETIPGFRSLLVVYEPAEADWTDMLAAIRAAASDPGPPAAGPVRRWTLPVSYGGPLGEDLADVATRCGLTPDGVVAAHSAPDYLVYLMGFAPGIPLLGGLPDVLRLPRRAVPRPRVAARSVVIAAGQASVMSIDAPSGWHVLGRTAVWPFQPGRASPFLFGTGDVVRFRPVGQAEFASLAAAADGGEPVVTPEPLDPPGTRPP